MKGKKRKIEEEDPWWEKKESIYTGP